MRYSLNGNIPNADGFQLYKCAHIGAIPCFCGILRTEGTYIFAEEKPEHPFTKTLEKIAAKIGKF